MIIQDTGENYTNYFGKSSVLNIKVAAVTSDGVTHTATMQAGHTGTFQWQVNGVDVAGETGTTFTPVPSLPSNAEVNVVVTSLVYTSQGYKIVSVVIASIADAVVTAADGTRQLVDTTDQSNVIPLSTGRGLKFDGTQNILTENSIDLEVDDFTSLLSIDASTYLNIIADVFGAWSSTARCYFGLTSATGVRLAIGNTTLTGSFVMPANSILEIMFCYRASDRLAKLVINDTEVISGVVSLSTVNSITNVLAICGVNVGSSVANMTDFTYKDCYLLPTFFSLQDASNHFNNPERTLYWEDNVLKSDILSQAEIDDLQGGNGFWYPLTEIGNTGYVRNHAKPMPENLIKNADFTLGNNGDWLVPTNLTAEFDTVNKVLRITTTADYTTVSQSVDTDALDYYILLVKKPENSDLLRHYHQVRQGDGAIVTLVSSPLATAGDVTITGALVFSATNGSVLVRNHIRDVDVVNAIFYPMYLAKLSDYGAVPITNWANSVMRIENLNYGSQSALTDNDNFGLSTGLTDKYLNLDNDTVDLTNFADLPAGDWAVDLYTSYANRLNLSVYNADLSLVENIEFVSAFTFSSYIQTIERVGNNILEYTNGILESTTPIAATVQDGVSRLRVVGGGKLGSVTYRSVRTAEERTAHIDALKLKHGVV